MSDNTIIGLLALCIILLLLCKNDPPKKNVMPKFGNVKPAWINQDMSHGTETFDMSDYIKRLVNDWLDDTGNISSLQKMKRHQNFDAIVLMGHDAIAPIVEVYEERNGPLFMLLQDITGKNPVPKEHYGDFEAIRRIWIDQGKRYVRNRSSGYVFQRLSLFRPGKSFKLYRDE